MDRSYNSIQGSYPDDIAEFLMYAEFFPHL